MATQYAPTPPQSRRHTLLLFGFVILCAAGMVSLGWMLQSARPRVELSHEDQPLYGTDEASRRMSLAFNGIAADWYWMRSLQYVGRKMQRITDGEEVQLDDLRNLNLKTLVSLLNRATTLDPQFMPVYEYGGILLPGFDPEAAIKLLEKGISRNPSQWRLYQHLGYIYWKRKEYDKASAAYETGSKLPDAPTWLRALSARMNVEGGSRDTARELYRRMDDESDDEKVKQMAELRLAEIDTYDERDAIRQALQAFRAKMNRCPVNWRELKPALLAVRLPKGQPLNMNAAGEPFDPSNAPYALGDNGCDVKLGLTSKLPFPKY